MDFETWWRTFGNTVVNKKDLARMSWERGEKAARTACGGRSPAEPLVGPRATNERREMTEIGQPCRKCGVKVVKKVPRKQKANAAYHYHYYLYCPGCRTMYLLESQKYGYRKEA